MPQIPERWLLYSPVGEPIAGTKLISFKVPLKDALCKRLKETERFTPEMLMERCPKLGLVIDLTFTTRYYDWEVFTSNGVQYKKIRCPGRVIPPDKLLTEFFNTVDAFLDETSGRDLLVGVHCTHGLNRTGYFLCRYMNLRMGIEPQKAIYAFEKARGHQMEQQPYIQVILSGKSLEDGKIMQHNHTAWGDHHSSSGPIDPNTCRKRTRGHSREHYPSFSQPPPLLHRRPDSLVPEFRVTSRHKGYIPNSSSVSPGPSISGGYGNRSADYQGHNPHQNYFSQPPPLLHRRPDSLIPEFPVTNRYKGYIPNSSSEPSINGGYGNRSADYQGHNPHQNYSRSKKRREKKKYNPYGRQSAVDHPGQSHSQSGTSRDAGLFGSNSANRSVNEFSVSTRTFLPSTFLNPKSVHSREHRPAFSQPPHLQHKHPGSMHPVSPLTGLYNECVSNSSYIHCGPPKNDGTG